MVSSLKKLLSSSKQDSQLNFIWGVDLTWERGIHPLCLLFSLKSQFWAEPESLTLDGNSPIKQKLFLLIKHCIFTYERRSIKCQKRTQSGKNKAFRKLSNEYNCIFWLLVPPKCVVNFILWRKYLPVSHWTSKHFNLWKNMWGCSIIWLERIMACVNKKLADKSRPFANETFLRQTE